ncbi:hypothetical protein HYDPIDRAFT_104265 [Hydnomerulius pinastri MD-312]|nr:hypothetical protein HYDPIDRAFT_104265 [Hydnomerulius pinastri MD-312]
MVLLQSENQNLSHRGFSRPSDTWPTGEYRYLNDFSKALASEVRILLAEVGKLRDERRQLQLYVCPFVLSVVEKAIAPG